MNRPIFTLLILVLAGCTVPQGDASVPLTELRAIYTITGERPGSLVVEIGGPAATMDTRLDTRTAVPITISAWSTGSGPDDRGSLRAYITFWIAGDWETVRIDEYCMASFERCAYVRTLFGTRGTSAPFGIGLLDAIQSDRADWSGDEIDLRTIATVRSGQAEYHTPIEVNSINFHMPNGTFDYDGGHLPISFEGLLLPFGQVNAKLQQVETGNSFHMPEVWPLAATPLPAIDSGLFFPGDEEDVWNAGATVRDAWAKLTQEYPSLPAKAEDGCINTIAIRNSGRSEGLPLGIDEHNFTRFDFTVDDTGRRGTRYGISMHDDEIQGVQWRLQAVEDSAAYGRCPFNAMRQSSAINATDFLSASKKLPRNGDPITLGAIYWDDIVQPFGISYEGGRFTASYAAPGSPFPYYHEMEMSTKRWHRLQGHPDDQVALGALPWNGPPSRPTPPRG